MMTMRAWLLPRPGVIEALALGEAPVPEPGAGQVRIRLAAASLNPADWKLIRRGWPGWRLPHVPGLDGAGVVDALGPGTVVLRSGDRVAAHVRLTHPGTFADYVLADESAIAKVPAGVTLSDAAAVPCAGFTAWLALERLGRPDGRMLVTAAAGGVGSFAVQLAKLRGMHVTVTASSANRDVVLGLGADRVVDYRLGDLTAALREASNNEGYDAILDLLGPQSGGQLLPLLRYGGAIACAAGCPRDEQLTGWPRGTSIHDIFLGGAYLSGDARAVARLSEVGAQLFEVIAAGHVRVPVTRLIPFGAIREALVEMSAGHGRGKIVAVIDEAL